MGGNLWQGRKPRQIGHGPDIAVMLGLFKEINTMSIGTILIILLIIFLAGGFSGRFGGYGYGYGHSGIGVLGVILIIIVVLMLTGRM